MWAAMSDSDDDDDDNVASQSTAARLRRMILLRRELSPDGAGKAGPRLRRPPTDPWACTWGTMLTEQRQQLQDPTSAEAKLFRLRFRVPFPLYLSLVEWTAEWFHWSPENELGVHDCVGDSPQKRHPTELKVLGVLRMLGRGTCLDGIQELSGISPATMCRFFHRWCAKFVDKVYPQHVYMPRTQEVCHIFSSLRSYCNSYLT